MWGGCFRRLMLSGCQEDWRVNRVITIDFKKLCCTLEDINVNWLWSRVGFESGQHTGPSSNSNVIHLVLKYFQNISMLWKRSNFSSELTYHLLVCQEIRRGCGMFFIHNFCSENKWHRLMWMASRTWLLLEVLLSIYLPDPIHCEFISGVLFFLRAHGFIW